MRVLIMLTAVAFLACAAPPGCAQSAGAPRSEATVAPVPVGAAALQPGDVVRITVWRKPELSGEFRVSRDGTIAAPFYLGVAVGGVPISEVVSRIRAHIEQWESQPQVLVEPMFQVTVGGEVQRPDLYTLHPSTSVGQAVLLAGGPTTRANLRRVSLYRAGEQLRVDLKDPRDALAQSPIRSGDYLVVEAARPIIKEYVMPVLLAIGATASIARLFIR